MSKNNMQVNLYISCIFCVLFALSVQAATIDTLWVKATFYDFHANGSCPDFNPTVVNSQDIKYGIVADTLSSDRKPIRGKNVFFSYNIEKWYSQWGPGNTTIPTYTDSTGAFKGLKTVTYDTAYKNIMIFDSLPFIHTGKGTYTFDRSGTSGVPEFFWLDKKGFGNDLSGFTHNFSFTMELHTQFTYQPGLVFEFLGDDDVWVFVNGRLVMDLGGIHASEADTLWMDSIGTALHLEQNKTYPLDLFYAERHISNSSIKITSNMFTPISLAGPYIKRAQLFTGENFTNIPDTMKLTLSQSIACEKINGIDPDSILIYSSSGKVQNSVFDSASILTTCSKGFVDTIYLIIPNNRFSYTPLKDSISFVPGSPLIIDQYGSNPPQKIHNTVISHIPDAIISKAELSASPNPASARTPISSGIRQLYGNVIGTATYGTIISIYSEIPLKKIRVGSISDAYGVVEIYDAVGNIVQKELPVISTGRNGVYGVLWNVKNRNSRFVGNGTYLALLRATNIQNQRVTERIKIGVQQ